MTARSDTPIEVLSDHATYLQHLSAAAQGRASSLSGQVQVLLQRADAAIENSQRLWNKPAPSVPTVSEISQLSLQSVDSEVSPCTIPESVTGNSTNEMPLRLLVPVNKNAGLAAHIPDADGHPLCKTNIKASRWQVDSLVKSPPIVCRHCKRVQGQSLQAQG
jgi:hypothetical protein